MERRALGKGIGALISERPQTEAEKQEKVFFVKIDQVRPSPFQPREDFNPQDLEDLTQSIKEKGIIQPVLVRRKGDTFELIAGERRYRAAKSLNLQEIPVIVKDVNDQDSLEIALIENIQRQNLNCIEEARAYQFLIEKFSLTQERLAEVMGKARVTVTNILRLLKLPQEIQQEIKKGRITFAHGRALLEIDDLNLQRKLVQNIIMHGLSVQELENLIKSQRPRAVKKKHAGTSQTDVHLAVAEEELQHIFATKVRISKRQKRGNIQIEFYSQEDLDRIITILKGAKRQ
jgi:ParB family chromosome partitioning protein